MDDGRAVKGEKVVGGNVNVIGAGGETTDNMYTLHTQYMYSTWSTNVRANEPGETHNIYFTTTICIDNKIIVLYPYIIDRD
jgi:hypothetical protein